MDQGFSIFMFIHDFGEAKESGEIHGPAGKDCSSGSPGSGGRCSNLAVEYGGRGGDHARWSDRGDLGRDEDHQEGRLSCGNIIKKAD